MNIICRSIKYENILLVFVIALIELATALMCIAMHNFSLALVTAVVYVPIVFLITPHHESASRWARLKLILIFSCLKFACLKLTFHFYRFRCCQYIMWIMLHPFISSAIVVMGYTYLNFPTDPISSLFLRSYRANKQALVFSIVDSMIYGNWFYNVATAVMLPMWMLFWNVMHSSIATPLW